MFGKKGFSGVIINGEAFDCSGNNIAVQNGTVIVDGKVIRSDISGGIHVVVHGDVDAVDCSGSVEIHGACGMVDCFGSCTVNGNVGSVNAGGSVTCGTVVGDVNATGSVYYRR